MDLKVVLFYLFMADVFMLKLRMGAARK